MSFSKAYRTYQSLMPVQKRLLRQKRIEATYSPGRWLRLFDALAEYDRYGDACRHRCGVVVAVAFVAMVVSLLVLGFADLLEKCYWISLGLAALGGLALLVMWYMKRSDLPNNLREFILPLLTILREDMEPDSALSMHLDLRGGTLRTKQTGGPTRIRGATKYPKIVETPYTDSWLSAKTRLADGTTLEWQVTDDIRRCRITKKTARGKIKTKWKYKIKRFLDIRLGLPQDTYAPETSESLPPEHKKFSVRPGPKRHVVKARRVFKSSHLDAVLDLQDFVDLMASAYNQMTLSQPKGS